MKIHRKVEKSSWLTLTSMVALVLAGGCGPQPETSEQGAAEEGAAALTFTGSSAQGTTTSISAGGSASGTFLADTYYSGGSTYSTSAAIDTSLVPAPVPPQSVFQHERYGNFTYTIPGLSAGSPYAVTLYFVESYWTAAGQRLFNVAINGSSVLSAFDIFAAAGARNKAIARTFNTTANSSGQVVIAFTNGAANNAKVDGITVAARGDGCGGGTAAASDTVVSLSSLQQKISGFGVSSSYATDFRDPARDPDMLWSTTTGAGLTLHRIRIGGGATSETKIAKKAVQYGVKVWATPWEVNEADTIPRSTCPGNGSCSNPPKLSNPQDWANRLVSFVNTMKSVGVPIYAISAENEPDGEGINHTTSFTAAELATWIGSYMGPAFASTGTKLMAPETMNWYGFPSYFSAIQSNSAAWGYVSIFASHRYGLGPSKPEPTITAAGKEYWDTEFYDTESTSDDQTVDNMPSALNLAATIHDDLTKANLNAFHYFWVYGAGITGLYDTNTNVWTKRFWVMGNFSRFVRPGYMRVSTSGTVPSGVRLSAYTNPGDGTVVVVAINANTTATPVSVFISGAAPCSVRPWVTSATDSLASKPAIPVNNSRFSASLGAKTVTTFVGKP